MTTGCKYYLQVSDKLGSLLVNYGPYKTLPAAQADAEKVKNTLPKTRVQGAGATWLRILKVIEEQHLGGGA